VTKTRKKRQTKPTDVQKEWAHYSKAKQVDVDRRKTEKDYNKKVQKTPRQKGKMPKKG